MTLIEDDMKGHPFADAWPMMPDDEIAELSADIAAHGLRESVVIFEGAILDGRNRRKACVLANVVAQTVPFTGSRDEALAFVQSVNNERRHQSKGSRAASWALSMLAAGKRDGGRWAYGEAKRTESGISVQRGTELGIIADHAPDLLYKIRADDLSLNAAYEAACEARDRVQNQQAAEAREAEDEDKARAFLEANDPDGLATKPGDPNSDIQNYREALAMWEQRNRDAAAKERQAKADHDAAVKRTVQYLLAFLTAVDTVSTFRENPMRDDVLAAMPAKDRDRFLRLEKETTWPTN